MSGKEIEGKLGKEECLVWQLGMLGKEVCRTTLSNKSGKEAPKRQRRIHINININL